MMKRVSLTATLLLCLSAAFGQTAQQWRDSLSVLSRQIERYPRSTDLRLKKAAVNMELGQWEYAVEEYGNVLRIDKENPAALYYRAYANMHLRQLAMARSDYETFLQKYPIHFEARLGLAHVLQKMGRKTDAMDELNRVVQMFPDSADAYSARAAYETELAQYDIALYDWDEAIRRKPLSADLVASKADVLIAMKRTGEARRELEAAVRRGVLRAALKEWLDKCK